MLNDLSSLDNYDQKILRILSSEGRISMTALAQKIGLSKTPTQARVKRLEDSKIIRGYGAAIDPIRLGLDHVAFVEVKLNDTREKSLDAFNAAVREIVEVEQVHMIAGHFDYLLKVRTSSMTDYRKVLGEAISNLPHVANTSTFVSMQSVLDTNFSPL